MLLRHPTRLLTAGAALVLVAFAVTGAPAAAAPGKGIPTPVKGAATAAQDAALIAPYKKLTAMAGAKGADGVYYDAKAGDFVVLTDGNALTAADFRGAGATVRVRHSAVSKATIDSLGAHLSSGDFHPDAKGYRYAWGHNLVDDTLEVETNAPPAVMAPLTAQYTLKVTYGDVGRMARDNDPAPHWGGAAVIPPSTNPCTAGFTVRDGAGNRYMTTAGHCADLYAGYNGLTGQYWGLVVARAPYPFYDIELIGGSAYDPIIYGGDFIGIARGVYGADDPVVGFNNYCRSGTITTEVCGLTVTGSGTLCAPPGGCTSGLVRFTGGTPARGGDSGAPFYVYALDGAGVHARGSFVGRATEGATEVGYAEYWNSIVGAFGVSIVTIFG